MTKHDLRDALIDYLKQMNEMVWEREDDELALAYAVFYKQGVMEFFTFLEDRMDEEA